MTSARLNSKGQITLPKAVRERLGLAAGDSVRFIEEQGRVWLEKEPEIAGIFGVVKARKSASLASIEATVVRGWQGRLR